MNFVILVYKLLYFVIIKIHYLDTEFNAAIFEI